VRAEGLIPAWLLQVLGIVLLIAAAVFWAVTGKESVLLVSSAMSLILLGAYKNVVVSVRRKVNGHEEGDHSEEKK
jgi:hypothetical protein